MIIDLFTLVIKNDPWICNPDQFFFIPLTRRPDLLFMGISPFILNIIFNHSGNRVKHRVPLSLLKTSSVLPFQISGFGIFPWIGDPVDHLSQP